MISIGPFMPFIEEMLLEMMISRDHHFQKHFFYKINISSINSMSNHVIYFSSSSSKLIPPWLLVYQWPRCLQLDDTNLSLVTTQTSEKMVRICTESLLRVIAPSVIKAAHSEDSDSEESDSASLRSSSEGGISAPSEPSEDKRSESSDTEEVSLYLHS